MLATLTGVTFLVTSSGVALSPFLLDMARDFGTSLGTVAHLVATMSLTWGAVSVVAGRTSDRVGRRPVLAAGVLVLGATRLALGLTRSYPAAMAWSALSGFGGGSYMGTVFAAVSDRVPPAQRGRAVGWVITGQSLSLLLGIPLVTLLGSIGGWRVAIASHSAVVLLSALAVWWVVPARAASASGGGAGVRFRGFVSRRVVALMLAATMERGCFAATAVYLAAFLLTTYGVDMQVLAGMLGLVAAGNLVGNVIGGWLADRLPARPLTFAVASALTGVLILPLMLWRSGPAVSVALGFLYSLVNGTGRPALMAALADVPPEVRGGILGLNITVSSVGWLGAISLGGWLIDGHGFGGLGVLLALAAWAGAGFAVAAWRADRR